MSKKSLLLTLIDKNSEENLPAGNPSPKTILNAIKKIAEHGEPINSAEVMKLIKNSYFSGEDLDYAWIYLMRGAKIHARKALNNPDEISQTGEYFTAVMYVGMVMNGEIVS